MQHQNSVFHTLLKHLPWGEFERLVEIHGADAGKNRAGQPWDAPGHDGEVNSTIPSEH